MSLYMLGPGDVSAGVLRCYPSSLLVYVCLFAVSRHGLSLPGTGQVPKLEEASSLSFPSNNQTYITHPGFFYADSGD